MKSTKKLLLIALLVLLGTAQEAVPDPWICHSRRSVSPLYTDTPVSGPDMECEMTSLENAPYNRISSEAFERYGAAHRERTLKAALAERAQLELPADLAGPPRREMPSVHTTWSIREVNRKGRKNKTGFHLGCELEGKASASKSQWVRVTITRGAVTIDTLEIQVNPGRGTPWSASLRGACRNPQVSIRTIMK